MKSMTTVSLIPHPDFPGPATCRIDVEYDWSSAVGLTLRYRLADGLDQLRIPKVHPCPERRDELWRHTCLELFMARKGEEAYREFNFSPSGDWACYSFDGYRAGMRAPAMDRTCVPKVEQRSGALVLSVTLPPELICPHAADRTPFCLAFTAVLETRDGRHHYWALRHAPGKPDFHHRDGFILTLVR